MKKKDVKAFGIAILIPLLVGGIAAWLVRDAMQNYQMLEKPPFSPPGWLFPIVWGILYVLMGISSYLIVKSEDEWRKKALQSYALQLGVNFFWPIFFFGFSWYFFSVLWIILLVFLIVVMMFRFFAIRPIAGILQLPYLVWCLFATYLTVGVWWLH